MIEMKTAKQAKAKTSGSARARDRSHTVLSSPDLRSLERMFETHEWTSRRAYLQARGRARARALRAFEGAGTHADASRTAMLVASAELFSAMRSELADSPEQAAALARRLEEVMGVSRLALARELLRSPELLTISPGAAVDAQLEMLAALAPLRSVSLWTLDDVEHVRCVRHQGEGRPSRGAKLLAARLLSGEGVEGAPRRVLLALPIGRWRKPAAALVGSARPGSYDTAQAFLAEAVGMLGAILDRDSLIAANVVSEAALRETSERKLTRLGFDLHDGPIQDVALLAEDLRLLRSQLGRLVGAPEKQDIVDGRMDDLDAQLSSLDGELRRISNEVRAASVLLNRPFQEALRDIVEAFSTRTGVTPKLALNGNMRLLSASQEIALFNILREALANAREHSGATAVQIRVSASEQGIEARIVDNGRGFDPEPTLLRAAKEGRLGLVAMHERIRLLGGQCRIDSRPGGPTVIDLALERWQPLTPDEVGTQR